MLSTFLQHMVEQQCPVQDHQEKKIVAFCFNTDCKEQKVACLTCYSRIHSGHLENMIQVGDFQNYINQIQEDAIENSNTYGVGQKQIIQGLEQLNKLIEDLQKIVKAEIQNSQKQHLQYIIEVQEQPGYKNYNEYIEKLHTYFDVQDQKISFRKDNQLAEIEKKLAQIIDKSVKDLKLIIEQFQQKREPKEKYLQFSTEPTILQQYDQYNKISGIALSQDFSIIATGFVDGKVKYSDARTKQLIKKIDYQETVQMIAFSPNKKYMALGGLKSVKLYDIQLKQLSDSLHNIVAAKDIIFSSDSQQLIIGVQNNLIVLDVNTREQINSYSIDQDICKIVIQWDDKFISCIGKDGTIFVWNYSTEVKFKKEEAHDLGYSLCSSKDMKTLVSCGLSENKINIKIWKNNNNSLVMERIIESQDDKIYWVINRVLLTSDEKYIISSCNATGKIRIHLRQSGQLIQELNLQQGTQQEEKEYSASILISSDMNMLISSSGLDGCLTIWNKEQ